MHALLERRDPQGPLRVQELFPDDVVPHLSKAMTVVPVPDGVVVGWMQRADGSFGPFVPSLADARALRLHLLRLAAWQAIIGGFESAALGSPRRYGSSDTDQTNIDRAAMAALSGQRDPDWRALIQVAAEDGTKTLVAHTAGQVHQVSSDLHAHIEAARVKREALAARVEAAATVDEVDAVAWG